MSKKITRSSGNIFADIGLENPEEHLLKSELAMEISNIISKKGLTQKEAADWIGATQSDISNLSRGRLKGFTYDRLFHFLWRMDKNVRIDIISRPAKSAYGRRKVAKPKRAYTDNRIPA